MVCVHNVNEIRIGILLRRPVIVMRPRGIEATS